MLDSADGVLVSRTREGETEAYGELVRRYQGAVFNVCLRLLGEPNEAEDMAQETFWRAYQRLATFDVCRPFGPWIRRVAANVCLNHLEHSRREALPLDEDTVGLPGPMRGPEELHEARELGEQIREALLELTPRGRLAIELRHFEGLSYEEIALDLGMTLSEVKSQLYRARRALARRLRSDV